MKHSLLPKLRFLIFYHFCFTEVWAYNVWVMIISCRWQLNYRLSSPSYLRHTGVWIIMLNDVKSWIDTYSSIQLQQLVPILLLFKLKRKCYSQNDQRYEVLSVIFWTRFIGEYDRICLALTRRTKVPHHFTGTSLERVDHNK